MKNSNQTRRKFIRNTALGTLGMATIPALAYHFRETRSDSNLESATSALNNSASNVVTRKNIASLAPNDPEIKLLKDAVGIMREKSQKWPLDPSGWSENGALHTKFCATIEFTYQVHYSWFVWPWHRAYLWTLEKKLQYAVQEPQLALHYWDWTKDPRIPQHFQGDKTNPFFNDTRMAYPEDIIPLDFMNLGPALRTQQFFTFGGYPFPSNGKGPQIDGLAEQSFHNNIHNWIGGEMAGFVGAGYDPIFYGHHGNCDRFWEAWLNADDSHQNPIEEEWLEKTFYFTDEKGKPMEIKVKDVLDTEKLGYRFADLDFSNEYYEPMEDKIVPTRELVTASAVYNSNLEDEKKTQLLQKINVEDSAFVQLKFERAQLPYMPFCARVFFTFGETNLDTYNINCKYIGTFTILPITSAEKGLLERDVYMNVEITKGIAQRIADNQEIKVLFEPVQVRGREIPDEPLQLKDITFKILEG